MRWVSLKYILLSLGVLLVLSLIFLWINLYPLYTKPLRLANKKEAVLVLDKNVSAYQFAHSLKALNPSVPVKLFVYLIRLHGWAYQLKAGAYEIHPDETVMQLAYRVVQGDVLTRTFTIIEGSTVQRVSKDLANAPYLQYNSEDWHAVQGSHPNAEGLLLADTYVYRGGSSSKTLLLQANKNLLQYLDAVWASRVPETPYKNSYEMLIAASIIEKEASLPEDRRLISGVMINRLSHHMPLQMDPTVIYALGDSYTGTLTHKNMQVNSPYNTYIHKGLPPTPIAMVGRDAIDAAAHPILSNYYYFVARGDGTHQFSQTYEQQKKAIKKYQRKDSL